MAHLSISSAVGNGNEALNHSHRLGRGRAKYRLRFVREIGSFGDLRLAIGDWARLGWHIAGGAGEARRLEFGGGDLRFLRQFSVEIGRRRYIAQGGYDFFAHKPN